MKRKIKPSNKPLNASRLYCQTSRSPTETSSLTSSSSPKVSKQRRDTCLMAARCTVSLALRTACAWFGTRSRSKGKKWKSPNRRIHPKSPITNGSQSSQSNYSGWMALAKLVSPACFSTLIRTLQLSSEALMRATCCWLIGLSRVRKIKKLSIMSGWQRNLRGASDQLYRSHAHLSSMIWLWRFMTSTSLFGRSLITLIFQCSDLKTRLMHTIPAARSVPAVPALSLSPRQRV